MDRYVTLASLTAQGTEVLITEAQLADRVRALAEAICRDHPHGVHLIGVLKGAFVFLADLARAMACETTTDFIALSSYGPHTSSSGEVQLLKDLESSIEGRAVVIVEDIVDTGLTLASLQTILRARSPASLRTVCLVSKTSRRQVDLPIDYVGFSIDDGFVVGYGLDAGERYRHLPYLARLVPEP